MYDRDGFRAYFTRIGAGSNTLNTYCSFLNRIDKAFNGLDEAIAEKGADALMAWSTVTDTEPFLTYRSHARSVLKRYIQFRIEGGDASYEVELNTDNTIGNEQIPEIDANFRIEREMQLQVRNQISQIEPGLVIVDGGAETQVATGFIDILARDASGCLVVIELKAGKCPSGAVEQVSAYAQDISDERSALVRAMLVAGSYTDRTRAAAKWSGNVELKTYAYNLSFAAAE